MNCSIFPGIGLGSVPALAAASQLIPWWTPYSLPNSLALLPLPSYLGAEVGGLSHEQYTMGPWS